jgi:hypothetical protein
MSPKKREYLFIAGLFVLLAVFIIIVNVVVPEKTSMRLIAKVRYFDGSLDTLEITGYSTVGSCVRLRTLDGRQTILGANNVIIIEEVEDQ